jgi:hypothetical protein
VLSFELSSGYNISYGALEFNLQLFNTLPDTTYYLLGNIYSNCDSPIRFGTFKTQVYLKSPSYDLSVQKLIIGDTLLSNSTANITSIITDIGGKSDWTYDSIFFYISKDSILTHADPCIYKALHSNYIFEKYQSISLNYNVPDTLAGDYYMFFETELLDFSDSNSQNNILSRKVHIASEDYIIVENRTEFDTIPDYYLKYYSMANRILVNNSSFSLSYTFTSYENLSSPDSVTYRIYLSSDKTIDSSDSLLHEEVLPPNKLDYKYSNTHYVNCSSVGEHYLLVQINPDNQLEEFDYTNNIYPIEVFLIKPNADLEVLSNSGTEKILSNGEDGFVYQTIKNTGATYIDNIYTKVYLSADSSFSESLPLLIQKNHLEKLSAGGELIVTSNFTFPDTLTLGSSYFIITQITSPTDTTAIDTLVYHRFIYRNRICDLDLSGFWVGDPLNLDDDVYLSDQENYSYRVSNRGPDNCPGFDFNLYFSENSLLDSNDSLIYSSSENPFISIGANSNNTFNFDYTISGFPPGNYYLIAEIVSGYDSNPENNINPQYIILNYSQNDFYVSNFRLPDGFFYSQGEVVNTESLAGGSFYTEPKLISSNIILSEDTVFTWEDTILKTNLHAFSYSTSFSNSSQVIIPSIPDGLYFIATAINTIGLIDEENKNNNFDYWPIYIGSRYDNDIELVVTNPPATTNYLLGEDLVIDFTLDSDTSIFDVFTYSLKMKKAESSEEFSDAVEPVTRIFWGDTYPNDYLRAEIPLDFETGKYSFEFSVLPEDSSFDPNLENNKYYFNAEIVISDQLVSQLTHPQ